MHLCITLFFVLFSIAYFVWDAIELGDAKSAKEAVFYYDVLTWELLSFAAFCVVAVLAVASSDPWWSLPVDALLAVVLLLVNVRFFHLVRAKRPFSLSTA